MAFFYVNLGPLTQQTLDAYSTARFRQSSVDNLLYLARKDPTKASPAPFVLTAIISGAFTLS